MFRDGGERDMEEGDHMEAWKGLRKAIVVLEEDRMMMATEDIKDPNEDKKIEIESNDEEGGLKWTRMTQRMMTRGS